MSGNERSVGTYRRHDYQAHRRAREALFLPRGISLACLAVIATLITVGLLTR